jgi:hypothetical protein
MTPVLALLMAASSGLTLELSPKQNEILVGEPLRLAATWHAKRSLSLPADIRAGGWSYDYVQIWVEGPSGRHQYREIPPFVEERAISSTPLPVGGEAVSDLLLLYGLHSMKTEGYLFPEPGTYTVMVRYADLKGQADSNLVSVRVSEPSEAEAAVFNALKGDPNEIKLGGSKAQALFETSPESRYLRLARVARYREQERRLHEGRHPETGVALGLSNEQWPSFAANQYRRMAEDLEVRDWGAYEDVRLGMLVHYARRGGRKDLAKQARQRLLKRFPKSRAADEIRNSEARETKP